MIWNQTLLNFPFLFFAEKIVMTPSKEGKTTRIKIEKVKKNLMDASDVAHEAQGQHAGLVIKKQAQGTLYWNGSDDCTL